MSKSPQGTESALDWSQSDQYVVTFGDNDPPKSLRRRLQVVTFGDGETNLTRLPLGATKRNPKGYETEQQYLLAYRPTSYFRISDSEERASHRRWENSAPSLVQQKLDEYRGAKLAAKLQLRAKLPVAEGHCPNLILGT